MTDWEPIEPDPVEGEPEPWYRSRGPLTASIVAGGAVVFFVIALIVWLVARDGDDELTSAETTTTLEQATTTVAETLPTTTAPPVTAPPVTEPGTTAPPTSEAPTTPPPTTAPPPTVPAVTLPPGSTTTTTSTSVPVVTVPADPTATVWDIIEATPDLERLRDLLIDAELDDVLRGEEPFTLFAPSNDAWEVFAATEAGAAILADSDRVTTLILRHLVFPEIVTAEELFGRDEVLVATGEQLAIDGAAGTVDGAEILVTDIAGSNGMLHVVGRVLAP